MSSQLFDHHNEGWEKADGYAKALCDVYEYLKKHDVGAAMIRIRASGALP